MSVSDSTVHVARDPLLDPTGLGGMLQDAAWLRQRLALLAQQTGKTRHVQMWQRIVEVAEAECHREHQRVVALETMKLENNP